MTRNLGLDGVVNHFTLVGDELDLLRNKSGATRLGFAVLLKFLLWHGRFPRVLSELPDDSTSPGSSSARTVFARSCWRVVARS